MQMCDENVNYTSPEQIKLKIQLLMVQRKVTQNDLAKVIDVDISTFNKKINGFSATWRSFSQIL